MKISNMLEILGELQGKHGDVEVLIFDPINDTMVEPLIDAELHGAETFIILDYSEAEE